MKAKRIKRTDPAGPLAENAAKIVKVRLEELRGFTPRALKPEAKAAQHNMRIAAKRLRYTLETTGFCFDRSADIALRRTKDLQGLLGEMHDADVMLPRLREHRREMRGQDVAAVRILAADAGDLDPALAGRAPHIPSYRGIAVLEVDLIARRRFLFERFTEAWQSSERRGVWSALERSADRILEEAARRREAAARAERARRELDAAETTRREAAERAELAAAELAEAERRSRG